MNRKGRYSPRGQHPRPHERESTEVLTLEDSEHILVLYNDNVNTFDYVIDCLIEICQHSEEQAHQCALITHHKGRCEVLTGSWESLEPRNTALLERGLSAEIY